MEFKHLNDIKVNLPFAIGQVLWTSPSDARSLFDLKKDLRALGAINVGPGRYVYNGHYAKAIEWLRQTILHIGKLLNYEQWYLPKIVPKEVLDKYGCIDVWPAYLLKILPLLATKENENNAISEIGNTYFLDPVQCASLYEALNKLNLDEISPLKVMDVSGYTYRNEFTDKLNGTVKTIEFLRAEYVFIGKNFVKQERNRLLDNYISLFESMRLKWRLVVGSGCYDTPSQSDLDEYSMASDMESIPVLDIEIFSPSLDTWIEIIGASHLYGNKLSRFGYKNGYESGCMGIGLTRLAGLLLESLGPEVKKWNEGNTEYD